MLEWAGRPAGIAAALALFCALAAGSAGAGDEAPFQILPLRARGRALAALEVATAPGPAAPDLMVIYVDGSPPDERRRLDLFRLEPGATELSPRLSLAMPPQAVAFDVGDVHPAPGDELLLLSRRALEIRSLAAGAPVLQRVELDPPAPLPPRIRSFSRMRLVADWSGKGSPELLLPSLDGAQLQALKPGAEPRTLHMPILTEYFTPTPGPPPYDGILEATFEWPALTLADDDGDGRADLFALGRYGVNVFRSDGSGPPAEPTRSMPLRPFRADEELRYETTRARLFARDLDGDGLADLVVHRSSGRLFGSHATTEIHHNPGNGASIARTANASLSVDAGVADLELVDLDGDGRVEVFHSMMRMGLVQVLRFLTTRRAEVELRVFSLRPPGIQGAEEVWHGEVALAFNLEEGRIAGLLPNADGDWNGDGIRDLLYGTGRDSLALHLGRGGEREPGFDERVASQKIPSASWLAVVDADADGLQDLVIYDDWLTEDGAHLLRNRGILPGTSPSLRPGNRGDRN